jgi:hypothetical protein
MNELKVALIVTAAIGPGDNVIEVQRVAWLRAT